MPLHIEKVTSSPVPANEYQTAGAVIEVPQLGKLSALAPVVVPVTASPQLTAMAPEQTSKVSPEPFDETQVTVRFAQQELYPVQSHSSIRTRTVPVNDALQDMKDCQPQ